MTNYVVPTPARAVEMLEPLLGEKVQPGKGIQLKPATSYVATYVNGAGTLVAICALDLAFAAYAGAALSGIPAAAAKDAIAEKTITDNMAENVSEVMNIMSRVFMSDKSPHLRFQKLCRPGEDAAVINAFAATGRCDVGVSIARYGSGSLSFLLT